MNLMFLLQAVGGGGGYLLFNDQLFMVWMAGPVETLTHRVLSVSAESPSMPWEQHPLQITALFFFAAEYSLS